MVLMGDGGDGFEVRQVGVRVAEGLEIDELGVLLDGILELLRVLGGDEGGGDAVARQGVTQQVEGAAIDVLGRHDVVAALRDVTHGILHGGGAGSDRQAGGTAFEGGDAILEHTLGGVGQTAVDVARVSQTEAGLGVIEVMEDVAGGLVDRHRAGVGGRVGLLLSDMQLQRLKTVVLVCHGGLLRMDSCLIFDLPPCRSLGGWSGVASDNKPGVKPGASRTLSRLPIPLYKALESLASHLAVHLENLLHRPTTRRCRGESNPWRRKRSPPKVNAPAKVVQQI